MDWQTWSWILGGVVAGLAVLRATPWAKVILWSPMRGRVLLNGKPAAGPVLVRDYHWHWTDRKGTDRTVADANGEFAFPAIVGRMLVGKVLAHAPVIRQLINIDYGGTTHAAWYRFNHDDVLNAENDGRALTVVCRLDEEPRAHGEVQGLCEFTREGS